MLVRQRHPVQGKHCKRYCLSPSLSCVSCGHRMRKPAPKGLGSRARVATRDIVFRGIAALALVVVTVSFAAHGRQDCSEPQAANNAQSQQKNCEEWWIWFFRRTIDDPIAFFTLVLAVSTIGLWVVTWQSEGRQYRHTIKTLAIARRSANAALIQSKAAVAVELPYVVLDYVLLYAATDINSVSKQQIPGGMNIPKFCGTGVGFANNGRTNATLISQSINLVVAEILPETPDYGAMVPFSPGTTLSRDKPIGQMGRTIEISEDTIHAIAERQTFLWAFGYLQYKDFMGVPHEFRYCAKWPGVHPHYGNIIGFVYDSETPNKYTESY
jgi:hypothetical protein